MADLQAEIKTKNDNIHLLANEKLRDDQKSVLAIQELKQLVSSCACSELNKRVERLTAYVDRQTADIMSLKETNDRLTMELGQTHDRLVTEKVELENQLAEQMQRLGDERLRLMEVVRDKKRVDAALVEKQIDLEKIARQLVQMTEECEDTKLQVSVFLYSLTHSSLIHPLTQLQVSVFLYSLTHSSLIHSLTTHSSLSFK